MFFKCFPSTCCCCCYCFAVILKGILKNKSSNECFSLKKNFATHYNVNVTFFSVDERNLKIKEPVNTIYVVTSWMWDNYGPAYSLYWSLPTKGKGWFDVKFRFMRCLLMARQLIFVTAYVLKQWIFLFNYASRMMEKC